MTLKERHKKLSDDPVERPTRFDKMIWRLFTGYSEEAVEAHLISSTESFAERKKMALQSEPAKEIRSDQPGD